MGDIDRTIGGNFRKIRLAAGLSQTEIGRHLGVSFQQIQKYENGSNRLSAETLYRTARLLELPVSWFYEGPGPAWVSAAEMPGCDVDMLQACLILKRVSDGNMRAKILQALTVLAS